MIFQRARVSIRSRSDAMVGTRSRETLDALVKRSRGEGYDAESAMRSLALMRIQLSTIAREMRERHDVRADVVQKVLDSIK